MNIRKPSLPIYVAAALIATCIAISFAGLRFFAGASKLTCMFVVDCSGPIQVSQGKVSAHISGHLLEFEPSDVEAVYPNEDGRPGDYGARLKIRLPPDGAIADDNTKNEARQITIFIRGGQFDDERVLRYALTDWIGREAAPPGTIYHHNSGDLTVRQYSPNLQAEVLPFPPLKDLHPGPIIYEYVLIASSEDHPAFVIQCDQVPPANALVPNQCSFAQNLGADLRYEVTFPRMLLPRWRDIYRLSKAVIIQSKSN